MNFAILSRTVCTKKLEKYPKNNKFSCPSLFFFFCVYRPPISNTGDISEFFRVAYIPSPTRLLGVDLCLFLK